MKKIFSKIRAVFSNRRFQVLLCGVLVIAGLLFWYVHYSKTQFVRVYHAYELASAIQRNAAFVPGATENPVRDRLNTALERLLGDTTPTKDRLVYADAGLELLDQLNKQVDAINDAAPPVTDAIAQMDAAANSPGNLLYRSVMSDLVQKAKAQMETIQNIRGLSYKANFETIQIFKRIIADKGVLTSQYASELNNDIPVVETEFNNRQNAYTDLQTNMYSMENTFNAL